MDAEAYPRGLVVPSCAALAGRALVATIGCQLPGSAGDRGVSPAGGVTRAPAAPFCRFLRISNLKGRKGHIPTDPVSADPVPAVSTRAGRAGTARNAAR